MQIYYLYNKYKEKYLNYLDKLYECVHTPLVESARSGRNRAAD
ncbi:MAG: hypothetical protein ACI944_001545 [Natronomonas sp.]|jgi:hypothetical protein